MGNTRSPIPWQNCPCLSSFSRGCNRACRVCHILNLSVSAARLLTSTLAINIASILFGERRLLNKEQIETSQYAFISRQELRSTSRTGILSRHTFEATFSFQIWTVAQPPAMVLLAKHNHENQGQMPRQQLPSIREIFGESYPLAFPSGPSYARPPDPSHPVPPALPAVYGIDHSNEGTPSNEQGLLFKVSTVGRSLGNISHSNGLQHLEPTHPANPTSRSVNVSRAFSRRLLGVENASSSVSSQEASVSRHQFCHPKMLPSSTSTPDDCSLNEPCRFSKRPGLSTFEPGSLPRGPVDSAQSSFAESPNVFCETPIKEMSNLIPPESLRSCQPEKRATRCLDLSLSFKVVREHFSWSALFSRL